LYIDYNIILHIYQDIILHKNIILQID